MRSKQLETNIVIRDFHAKVRDQLEEQKAGHFGLESIMNEK